MRTPSEIVEARWPGWLKEHDAEQVQAGVPVLDLMVEAQREALEFAAQAAEIEDDGEEVARICRAKAKSLGAR